jgi:hypothetical protein
MISPCRIFHRRDAEYAESEDFLAKHVLSHVEGPPSSQSLGKNLFITFIRPNLAYFARLRELSLIGTPRTPCLCGEKSFPNSVFSASLR